MESYYIIMMDILWISLHPNTSPTDLSGPGYWHYCPDCVLPYIFDYMPCLAHDIATAHPHDYAWTAKWAQNICTLSMPMSLMRLRYDDRQHGRRVHLYGTNGTWKNYPTWCTLLGVGFMIILRRVGGFVLIWACSAVLTEPTTAFFQMSQP